MGIELEGKELFPNQLLFDIVRLGYEGYQNIKSKISGGAEKIVDASTSDLKDKMSTPDPNFDSEKLRVSKAT